MISQRTETIQRTPADVQDTWVPATRTAEITAPIYRWQSDRRITAVLCVINVLLLLAFFNLR